MKWYISVGDVHRWIEAVFYRHGMFCASHPFGIISMVITIAFITCYPLFNLPLPGNAPLMYNTPVNGYTVPEQPSIEKPQQQQPQHDPKVPRWFVGEPVGYIQQFVIKSVVSPWHTQRLIQTDAFRAPLSTVFNLVQHINNFKIKSGNKEESVGDLCLRVSESTAPSELSRLLPLYNCLIISPANFWKNDKTSFDNDGEIIKTIFNKLQPGIDAQPSVKDMLFGVAHKDTGVKKFFLRNRQRLISYAVTIVMKKYDAKFINGLRDKLLELYPQSINSTSVEHLAHIHYKIHDYFVEYTPLIVTYAVLFLYIYFSVRKIEMVKSKWGLAFSAVVTVVASLLISVSICLLFGLTPSLNGSEIFPYLVVIIGLENVLVVTKSVVSTPVHLDVKLRVAQGISKEGWYIFKNLVTELAILAVGFLTFVPAIQEFCLFAVVGLLTDFFLQMFFFTTVLSIDIRRMELSDLHKQSVQQSLKQPDSAQYQHYNNTRLAPVPQRPTHSHPHRPVMALRIDTGEYLHELSPPPSPTAKPPFTPQLAVARRVKLLNFWARTRVFQKIMMFCMVVWIALIVHKAGIVQHFTNQNASVTPLDTTVLDDLKRSDGPVKFSNGDFSHGNGRNMESGWSDSGKPVDANIAEAEISNGNDQFIKKAGIDVTHDEPATIELLKHEDTEQWKKLSYKHWPMLFSYYNISLQGKYLTILPSIQLCISVDMDTALALRHPTELQMVSRLSSYYNYYASNYYESDTNILGPNQSLSLSLVLKNLSVFPRTTAELLLHIILAIATLFIFIYFLVWLYKCMCPKNYGRWRASWYRNSKRNSRRGSQYYKQIRESLPLVLQGHVQEVECIAVDGPLVVSACLGGFIKVWDSTSGECRTTILRHSENVSQTGTDTDMQACAMERGDGDFTEARFKHSHSLLQDDTNALTRKRHPSKHTRYKSADLSSINFEDIAPDLSSKIQTDFTAQERARSQTVLASSPNSSMRSPDSTTCSPHSSISGANTMHSPHISPSSSGYTSYAHHAGASSRAPSASSQTPSSANRSCHISPYSTEAFTFPASNPTFDADRTQSPYSSLLVPSAQNIPIPEPEVCTNTQSFIETTQTHADNHSSNAWRIFQSDSSELPSNRVSKKVENIGFDFGPYISEDYEEHRQFIAEKNMYMEIKQRRAHKQRDEQAWEDQYASLSLGESPGGDSGLEVKDAVTEDTGSVAPVWCMQCQHDLIVAGCGNGTIEFWDGLTGELKFQYCKDDVGVTNICFNGKRVIAARLSGSIDFLELQSDTSSDIPKAPPSAKPSKAQKRGHRRVPSSHSVPQDLQFWDGTLDCTLLNSTKAHQRPVTFLLCRAGRLVSASQDYTLKVFRLEDQQCVYTLYGHKGSITALCIDDDAPVCAISGAEEGSVRLWDLSTGVCLHKLHGHTAPVVSVTGTRSHIVSTALDDRLCIWDRARGTLRHWIQMESGFCNSVCMLTSNLMISGAQGCLYLWDAIKGEVLRVVELGGNHDNCVNIRQLHVIDNCVVCDFGNQLRVIRFPSVLEKAD